MAYTPELSLESSRTLRRIAWALGVPMTQAIERVFEYMPRRSCLRCRKNQGLFGNLQGQIEVAAGHASVLSAAIKSTFLGRFRSPVIQSASLSTRAWPISAGPFYVH